MTYQPQRITAPDGTEMVVIRAEDYDRLVAAAALDDDRRDARMADRALALSDVRYPAAVVDAILGGATPLRAWRVYRGLSQISLAEAANLSATGLNKLELGKRDGRPATLRAVAKALDIPVSALDPLED
jgi:DNA-binding XRE family transcriptional regulator